ncbi:AraC family transcriptional regulator [Globicatella sanguinis]|uniref:AraC family transcriptional regulator n=1 Tax=Globicatella sanguinis TaxID=13076 RepID=UPI002150975A|nr:AraC family ligand binding domain-containing protein [Globicatella sanguinis]MDK7630346.1 AraC family ligand binding domain-containing protein [Globicatella sanguinis]WIK67372.1 AraC family ligand binding domain-containing protein [Globicatella sanguinis]WKT56777.1 AraC family ligand binding domain-containing protein [Globicatella sanguinis]
MLNKKIEGGSLVYYELHQGSVDLMMDFCGYEKCPPKYGFGPAIRDNYVLHYIEEGKGQFIYNGKTYHLKAGDLFLLKENELLYYEADINEPWSYYWLGLSGTKVADYFKLSTLMQDGYAISKDFEDTKLIGETIKFIVTQNITKDYYSIETLQILSKIYEVLYLIAHQFPPKEASKQKSTQQLYFEARTIIDKQYGNETLNVNYIAELLGVNRSYLSTIFKEYEQMTPKDYLTKVRMNRAKQLLESSDLTVKIVALSVGYADPLYFSKSFKKYYGYNPSEVAKVTQNTEL